MEYSAARETEKLRREEAKRIAFVSPWMDRAHSLFLLVLAFACFAGCGTAKTAPPTEKMDRIVVEKSAHTMKLMHGDEVVRTSWR